MIWEDGMSWWNWAATMVVMLVIWGGVLWAIASFAHWFGAHRHLRPH